MTHATIVSFDADRMRRYDREGPRYTSYPTAQQFADGISVDEYAQAAAASRGACEAQPLSAYVHIPFCSSPCFYCGCNKIITHKPDRIDAYVGHLLDEITMRSRYFDGNRVMDQMHFGGGTPTYLPKKRLVEIIDRLGQEFQLSHAEDRDFSIEIDPRGADEPILRLLADLGFNRVSLGVQDFDENVQRAVNRIQPETTVARVYELVRSLGFRSINFDLIYGLPLQTVSSFSTTLDRVVTMRPDRIAVYGYAHMPRMFKAQRQIRNEELPNASTRLSLLQLAIGILLLLFGMRWLRKAILRSAGVIPLHDEATAFATETAELREQARRHEARLDWLAALASFKAVLLEGLEVVFIVIALSAGRGMLFPASAGALAACLLVIGVGFIVHRPLARVPENTLKFAVGVMLSAFGVFWTGEGLGVAWPGADLAIVAFAALFLAVGLAAPVLVRRPSAEGLR